MVGFRSLKALVLGVGLVAGLGVQAPAFAAGEEIHLPDTRFSFDGLFGHFDRASAQRGFQVYKEVCSSCQAMHQLSYRNLRELGLSENEVAGMMVVDGDDRRYFFRLRKVIPSGSEGGV